MGIAIKHILITSSKHERILTISPYTKKVELASPKRLPGIVDARVECLAYYSCTCNNSHPIYIYIYAESATQPYPGYKNAKLNKN